MEYQSSIDSFYESTPPPQQQRHYTASSRETSPQPSSSNAGSRLPRHPSDTSGPSRSNGGHYGRRLSPRERATAREPQINLWSLQEIEAKNLEYINFDQSIDVLQKYVQTNTPKLKNPHDLTDMQVKFIEYAISVSQQIRHLDNDARGSGVGVGGRLSEENIFKQNYDPLGENAKIRIYTVMQESLQAMATLISDGEVEAIKTYEYGRPPRLYEMSNVVNTLMHDAALNIVRLSSRFSTIHTPQIPQASINSLLLRMQRISI